MLSILLQLYMKNLIFQMKKLDFSFEEKFNYFKSLIYMDKFEKKINEKEEQEKSKFASPL